MLLLFSILLLTHFVVAINTLNLNSHGINEDFYASDIAVFRNKAYLALPRSSCHNNLTSPTLIEVYLNAEKEALVSGRRIEFPNDNRQEWGKCENVQDAVAVDVEVKKSRLWVLDRGSKTCLPKIIIFNLLNSNEIYKHELDGLLGKNVTTLVIDSNDNSVTNAFIGHEEGILSIFSLNHQKHWSLPTRCRNTTESSISTKNLALSKSSPVLYIGVDDSSELFYINLTDIKMFTKPSPSGSLKIPEIIVNLLGLKLGPSAGIVTDAAGGLNYFLLKDYAVARWNTRKPLKAENHEIVAQSFEDLPYVPQLFEGHPNTVWALINSSPPTWCTDEAKEREIKNFTTQHRLRKRILKLFRLKRKVFGRNSIDKCI